LPGQDGAGTWRERLEASAWESWRLYQRHPWLLDVAQEARPPLGPNVLDGYEALLRAVDGIGLSGVEMNATVSLLSDFVAGAARRARDAAQAERQSGESDASWWGARGAFWEEFFDPERYAVIARIYAEGGYDAPDEPFAYGLQRILDGIEARLRAPVGAREEHEHGDDLQPPQVHLDGQDQLGDVAEGVVGAHRPGEAEAGA
jgi:hypothetical protein